MFCQVLSMWNKIGSENRQEGETVERVGRNKDEMDAKQAERDRGGEEAKYFPEQGHGEPESQLASKNSPNLDSSKEDVI